MQGQPQAVERHVTDGAGAQPLVEAAAVASPAPKAAASSVAATSDAAAPKPSDDDANGKSSLRADDSFWRIAERTQMGERRSND